MKILFAILVLFFTCASWARWTPQSEDTLKVRLGIAVPKYNFEIIAPNESEKVLLEPNTPSKTSLGVAYRNLGLTVAFQNPTTSEDNKNYGSSSSTDLKLRLFGKRTYEVSYQSYSGYFIRNSEDLDSAYLGSSVKIQRSDIRTQNIGFNFYWNFDEPDFSQAMAFDQSGFQTETNWGLSWLVHISRSSLTGDAPFVPAAASSKFGDLGNLTEIHRDTIATGPALGGMAVFGNYYLTGLLGVGAGYQRNNLEFQTLTDETKEGLGAYLTTRIGLGYNGEKHLFGSQILLDNVNTSMPNGELRGLDIELSLFYAYRFDSVNIPMANTVSAWLN